MKKQHWEQIENLEKELVVLDNKINSLCFHRENVVKKIKRLKRHVKIYNIKKNDYLIDGKKVGEIC
jgi:peptidoglycan hydrolase CwlO-like protein